MKKNNFPSESGTKSRRTRNRSQLKKNNFPVESGTRITINPRGKKEFTLQLRYPEWIEAGALQIRVNGKAVPAAAKDGYVPVSRRWKKGDKVEVTLPMEIRTEQLPDHSHYYSFLYGPLVLAAQTGIEDQDGLFADDSRGWAYHPWETSTVEKYAVGGR
ncbi:MAG: glycoside hydrolase family 127 protein [Proteiniphilum sp.]|nr:glycoside hydrolase family 127 protein [Proteiniphilum sp.]